MVTSLVSSSALSWPSIHRPPFPVVECNNRRRKCDCCGTGCSLGLPNHPIHAAYCQAHRHLSLDSLLPWRVRTQNESSRGCTHSRSEVTQCHRIFCYNLLCHVIVFSLLSPSLSALLCSTLLCSSLFSIPLCSALLSSLSLSALLFSPSLLRSSLPFPSLSSPSSLHLF
jgi:hypothetical protein